MSQEHAAGGCRRDVLEGMPTQNRAGRKDRAIVELEQFRECIEHCSDEPVDRPAEPRRKQKED